MRYYHIIFVMSKIEVLLCYFVMSIEVLFELKSCLNQMDKDRLEIVRNTLQKNREDFEDKSQTYMEMESPMVRAK